MPTFRYTLQCARLTITITRSQDALRATGVRAWLVIVDLGVPRVPPQATHAATPTLAKAAGLQLAAELYRKHNLKPPPLLEESHWQER